MAPGTVEDDRKRTPSILLKVRTGQSAGENIKTHSNAKAKLDILDIEDAVLEVETDLDLGVRVP